MDSRRREICFVDVVCFAGYTYAVHTKILVPGYDIFLAFLEGSDLQNSAYQEKKICGILL